MNRIGLASVSVRGPSPAASETEIVLGEFHAVWKDGVSIGSDPGCVVVLPGLPRVAARVVAASNHKLLFRLPPDASLPLPAPSSPVGRYAERVDNREFAVGAYRLRFGEVYRDA
jgi:hypothetical protein